MTWRRAKDRLDDLMLSRRNVFIRLDHPVYSHALVAATHRIVVVHLGFWRGSFTSCESRCFLADDALFDGRGWNLENLIELMREVGRRTAPDPTNGVENMPHTIDLENYKAFGSFCAVYTDCKHQLLEDDPIFGRQCLIVLDALAQRANPIGLTYAGLNHVMQTSHYAEGTVKRCLDHLFDRDWIRIVTIDIQDVQEIVRRWQISPFVLWIAYDHIYKALETWESACNRLTTKTNVISNGHPTPESNYTTNPQTNSLPTTTTTTSPQKAEFRAQTPHPDMVAESDDPADRDGADANPEPEPVRHAHNQRKAQSQKPSPGSAPPPPNLKAMQNPLQRPDDESLAHVIQARLHTRLPQARQLVAQFSAAKVTEAIAWLDHERGQGRQVRNPFGLVKWWLTNGAVTEKPLSRGEQLAQSYDGWVET